MPTKPTVSTDWAKSGSALKLQPSGTQQTRGWDTDDGTTDGVPEKPTLQHQNGWQSNVNDWCDYFTAKTDDLQNTSNAKETAVDYTLTDSDGFLYVNVTTSTSTIVITLPAVATNAGRRVKIRKADSGTGKVTIKSEGAAVTINGVDGTVGIDLSQQYAVAELFESGGLWGGFGPATSTAPGFLPYYEEGTWSPASAGVAGLITGTPVFNDPKYTRIGRKVFASINTITGLSISSNNSNVWYGFTTTGLPGVTVSSQFAGCAMVFFTALSRQRCVSIDMVSGADTYAAFGFESYSAGGSLSGSGITLYRVTFSYDIV